MKVKEDVGRERTKILIPTNFTGHAAIAGDYALRMLEGLPCTCLLETVYMPPRGSAGTLIKIADILMREAAEGLRKEREAMEFGHPGIQVQTKAEEGDAATVIGGSMKKEKADLLVIGHNSHVKKFLSRIIESPDTWPALLVPNKHYEAPPKSALCVCSPECGQSGLNDTVAAVEKRIEGRARKIHYAENEPPEALKKQIETSLRKNSTDMVIFKVAKRSEFEGIIRTHLLDEIILKYPVLLLSC